MQTSHVQFFFKYSSSKEADNMPTCTACIAGELEAFRRPEEALENPEDFFDPTQPVFSTQRVRPACSPPQTTAPMPAPAL